MSHYDIFHQLEEDCKEFVKTGGDASLFWAGRMSIYGRMLIDASITNISEYAKMFRLIINAYDNEILKKTLESKL